jgi:glyoxylase-like metal-dependent hydrolase (beta-lactamase superfamily II)
MGDPRDPIRPRWLVRGLIVLVMAGIAYLGYWFRSGPIRTWTGPVLLHQAMTVAPGIHMLGGLAPATAYVVETSAGLVAIDSGFEPDASLLKAEMTQLGLDYKDLHAILLTHCHGDHTGGAQHLRAATGAKVYAGSADAAIMKAGGPHEAVFAAFLPTAQAPTTTVDVLLAGGEVLDFGNVRFRVLATPGHSPGSVCYLMEKDNLRALFAGDVIVSLGDDRDALPQYLLGGPLGGTYITHMSPRYRGDARAFLATLQQLRALRVPDLVLPGHPRGDLTPQCPALSEERWQAILDRGIRDLETLQARQARDGTNYLDGTPVTLLPDLWYLGDFGETAVYAFRAASRLFLVNAPGGPGLLEHVSTRLQKVGAMSPRPDVVLLTGCGPHETAGLKGLVKACNPLIVAPASGLKQVKALCPTGATVLAAEDLPGKQWLDAKPVPLSGTSLAYQLSWAGKTVLLSGRVPIKINVPAVQAQELFIDMQKSGRTTQDYRESLQRLEELKPDLWLSTFPTGGYSPNLYDNDWAEIIRDNQRLLLLIDRYRQTGDATK